MPSPPRAHVRDLFLKLLGLVFLVAFLSLHQQVTLLVGSGGLLPVDAFLTPPRALLDTPTIFWLGHGEATLRTATLTGAVFSFGLVAGLAPRACLLALWALYLSFVTIGQDFLAFQWDNLLLETALAALCITPGGLRPRRAPPPLPLGVFLMLWLVFRLHVESGATKLLLGDPTWRDLTAMATYYETAPLPTWVGWYAHQMPLWAHRLCSLFTYVVELGLPLFVWGPRPMRVAVFFAMAAMQVSILLTANYGFFNYLSLALLVWVLDDGHLAWVAARVGRSLPPPRARVVVPWKTALLSLVVASLVALSVVPFLPFVRPLAGLSRELTPVRRMLATVRSVNAYHLFAQMTLVRREPVIEGSDDGTTWLPYEFHYEPGDPARRPRFVAPHQPRVDFLNWFLFLGGRGGAPYFDTLLARILDAPDTVAPLFARNPFPDAPPRLVRVAVYRYRFTDLATRRATGAWWQRELTGHSAALDAAALRRTGAR
jgi:hypothetical protein